MKNTSFLWKLLFCISFYTGNAQQDSPIRSQQGWATKFNIGIDFLSNLLINPTVGGGESRLGIGGSLNLFTIHNNEKFSWQNDLNIAYGIQKSGTGFLEDIPDKKVPFQKNMDNIWLNSKLAQRTSYFSKFYYAADLFFSSQLTETYQDNFLSDIRNTGEPISKFLSPALFQASLGMDYRPNDYWSIFLSPVSYKSIIVLDDAIANNIATDVSGGILGSIHGNETTENDDGSITFSNYDHQIGGGIRLLYRNNITERLSIHSNLLLFSNYQNNPDHIDINWRNEINLTVFKGFNVSLLSLLSYDHDVFVQISDNEKPGGFDGLGRRVSYTQQLVLRYSYVFDKNKKEKFTNRK